MNDSLFSPPPAKRQRHSGHHEGASAVSSAHSVFGDAFDTNQQDDGEEDETFYPQSDHSSSHGHSSLLKNNDSFRDDSSEFEQRGVRFSKVRIVLLLFVLCCQCINTV